MLDKLGHPERSIPPVIHVAGTNGKGSTVAFMRAVLEAAGKSVHVYTSPHLVRFNERFRIGAPNPEVPAGQLVSDEALAAVLEECERANGAEPITVFEIETAAAFLLFSRQPADLTLLEVGLGGRLDATNVIEAPLACAITPVSMDHLEFLGDTIEKIAAEKAAILQAPCAGGDRAADRRRLGRDRAAAQRVRAPLHVAGQHWSVHGEHGRLVYQDETGCSTCRCRNSPAAIRSTTPAPPSPRLRAARLALPIAAFEAGIAQGRMAGADAAADAGALKALTPPESELWLDGGHNADGGRAVAAAIGDLEERVSRPLVLIVGMLSTKDNAGFLRNFTGIARRVIAVPVPRQDKSVPAETLVDMARERRHSGREPRHVRSGARRGRAGSICPRAAHPDHRLALSRRRSAGAERHAAAV